jgi:hypothetical protein
MVDIAICLVFVLFVVGSLMLVAKVPKALFHGRKTPRSS